MAYPRLTIQLLNGKIIQAPLEYWLFALLAELPAEVQERVAEKVEWCGQDPSLRHLPFPRRSFRLPAPGVALPGA